MVRGSCLCKGIAFEVDGPLGPIMGNCHCSMCRKSSGSAFETVVSAPRSALRWIQGESLVTRYASSDTVRRCFCRTCGSHVPDPQAKGEQVFIPAGALDDDPGLRPAAHIFVGSKASWHDIRDDLPKFEEWPPGYEPSEA
jgi:hypothetical protein